MGCRHYRDRPARLDEAKGGIIGKPIVSNNFAIGFKFFKFVVEYLK
jgi:hypothetical protein